MLDLTRRQFLTLLGGGAAAAWPFAARAQQATKTPRIGIIDDAPRWKAFRHGLRDLGYLEGQNIAFDYSYGEGVPERLAEAAATLVRRPVDVIATYGTPASLAAKQATTTIPIVMISIGDPVRAGLVPSLARPGGNITAQLATCTKFCKAPSPPTCRWNSRSNSSWPSTSKPPGHSGLRCRPGFSPSPTR